MFDLGGFICQEIEVVDLQEPSGWIVIPLKDLNEKLVRTFMVQIAVIQNHQQVYIIVCTSTSLAPIANIVIIHRAETPT